MMMILPIGYSPLLLSRDLHLVGIAFEVAIVLIVAVVFSEHLQEYRWRRWEMRNPATTMMVVAKKWNPNETNNR
jgi:hypothetical protein